MSGGAPGRVKEACRMSGSAPGREDEARRMSGNAPGREDEAPGMSASDLLWSAEEVSQATFFVDGDLFPAPQFLDDAFRHGVGGVVA